MKPFKQFLTEQTTELYHGSFRPRIEKFFPLTHIGSYDCAVDRVFQEFENNPLYRDQDYGYIYKVTADISNSAEVADHFDVADPPNSFEKFSR